MVWVLKITQQRSFEGSNKPGRYLAHMLKKKRQNTIINKIGEDGKEIGDRKGIKKAFYNFYSKLYKSKGNDLEKNTKIY